MSQDAFRLSPAFEPTDQQSGSTFEITEIVPIKLTSESDAPYYRLQSSFCVDEESHTLVLFGGFDQDDIIDDDVYLLDLSSGKWLTPRKSGIFREGHSLTSLSKDKCLIFGGLPNDMDQVQSVNGSQFKNPFLKHSQMLIYSISSDSWSVPLQLPADAPGPVSRRHAICLSSDKRTLFVSGGYNSVDRDEPSNDFFSLDCESGKWERKKFISRFDHFIFESDDKIWSFGGLSKEMNHVFKITNYNLKTDVIGDLNFSNLPNHNKGKGVVGSHCYLQISNTKIMDILVPSEWTLEQHSIEPLIGYFDLATLKYTYLISGNTFKPLVNYVWKHCFVHDDNLCMLGYPIGDVVDSTDQYKLTHLLKIPLSMLGLSETVFRNSTDDNLMLSNFYKMYQDSEFTDFQIYGIKRDSTSALKRPDDIRMQDFDDGADNLVKSDPIKVHKLVLMVRWPYFKKLYESGMSESQNNKMFIQEPIELVELLVEFLYTNAIKDNLSIETIGKLLLLAEMYQLIELKSLLLGKIYSDGFTTESILLIWQNSIYVHDPILRMNTECYIYKNWGKITKTKQFKNLSKELILQLFENLGDQSSIIVDYASSKNFTSVSSFQQYESPVLKRQRLTDILTDDEGGSSTSEMTTPVPTGNPLTPTTNISDGLHFLLPSGSNLSHLQEANNNQFWND